MPECFIMRDPCISVKRPIPQIFPSDIHNVESEKQICSTSPPVGIPRPRTAACLLRTFPNHIPSHCAGKTVDYFGIISDSHLHTLMYFFLSQIVFTLLFQHHHSPQDAGGHSGKEQMHQPQHSSRLTQLGFILIFEGLESFLFAAVAYDRYSTQWGTRSSWSPASVACWFCSPWSPVSWMPSWSLMGLHRPSERIWKSYFFCELAQVLPFSITSWHILWLVYLGMFSLGCSLILKFFSIFRMPSLEGKLKTCSTCGSPLCIVSLFYATAFGAYISFAVTLPQTLQSRPWCVPSSVQCWACLFTVWGTGTWSGPWGHSSEEHLFLSIVSSVLGFH